MGNFFNRPLGVIIIGCVLCIGAIAGFYFLAISKQMQALNEQTSIYNDNKDYLGQGPLSAAQKKVADAKVQVAQAESQWDVILRTKNPDIDLSDAAGGIFNAWKELTNELVFYLGPDLERQLKSTKGVTPTTGVSIGGPPNDPNAIIQIMQPGWFSIPVAPGNGGGGGPAGGGGFGGGFPGGFGGGFGPPGGFPGGFAGRGSGPPAGFGGGRGFGPPAGFGGGFGGGGGGSLKVVGTFPLILKHVKSWNNFNRIAKVTGLTLSGNSPNLTGSYNVTIYEFPRNVDKHGKLVPSQSGGGGGGTAGTAGGPAGAPPMAAVNAGRP